MADNDPFNLNALLDPLSSVDIRKLLLLPVGQGQAPNVINWQGVGPTTAVNPSPAAPGATAAGNPAIFPVAPSRVVAPIPMGSPSTHGGYPTPLELTNRLYNETSSQRETPGGSSLDAVRQAMGNVILNRRDQNVRGREAPPVMKPRELGSIIGGELPHASAPALAATNAWYSSLDAALSALMRPSAPLTGPASGVFYHQRAAGPHLEDDYKAENAPFLGAFGPYDPLDNEPYWAFFGSPRK